MSDLTAFSDKQLAEELQRRKEAAIRAEGKADVMRQIECALLYAEERGVGGTLTGFIELWDEIIQKIEDRKVDYIKEMNT